MVAIHGDQPGIASDAQRLQQVSDEQGALMSQLGSTIEGLGCTLQGTAGVAMQNIGANMIQQGKGMSVMFADQSSMMSNNGQILNAGDEDNAHLINQLGQMVV